jgi:hypothetical protein
MTATDCIPSEKFDFLTGFMSLLQMNAAQVFRCAVVVFIFLMAGLSGSRDARAGDLVLNKQLLEELNLVLKASDVLHKSLLTQDDEQVDLSLRDLLRQLEKAQNASGLAKPHERGHLMRILSAAHEQFELTQSSYGEDRRVRMEEGYNQLVNLVRIYRVDTSYAIFFCPKDRTTWIQKGARAQNPFQGESRREPCAIQIPKKSR